MPYLTKLLPLIAGAFFCFGYPSFITEKGFPVFIIICFTLFRFSLTFENKKQDLINIFLFGTAINVFCFYWIPQTITTFGQLPSPVSYFLFLLFGLIVIPFTWTSYLIFFKLKNFPFVKKLKEKPEVFVVLASASLTLIEYYTPSQFPVRLGQSWMNHPIVLGLAPFFGLPIYSFLTYQIVLTLFEYIKRKRILKANIALSIIILLTGIFIKPWSFQPKTLNSNQPNIDVRIVQANIGNYMKIQSELGQFNSLQEVYNRYFKESVSKTVNDIDLIIWPETAYPEDLNTDNLEGSSESLPPIFKNIISSTRAEMLVGGYDKGKLDKSQNGLHTVYNSAFHFSHNAEYLNVYHKHLLIPFGETVPLGPITPYVKDYIPGVSFFSKDEVHTVFTTKDNFHFVVPICYELLSPQHISNSLEEGTKNQKQPHLIINLTNDSWYGRTAQPYQHLFLAKWRAVEFQTPIIRSTNSGITSVFDIDGEESRRLYLGEVKHLDLSLYLPERRATLYQKIGILGLIILSLLISGIFSFLSRKRPQGK